MIVAPGSQIAALDVFFPERDEIGTMLSATVKKDQIKTPDEALIEIYRACARATRRPWSRPATCSRACS